MRTVILLPFTLIYYLIISLWGFSRPFTKKVKLPARIISVGNITVGGSGKTSLTEYIVRGLIARDKKTVVVARGYGRKGKNPVVARGEDDCRWEVCGDEPAALVRTIPGLEVYVDSDKTKAAIRAVNSGYNYIVIDDGFQHRRLARDLDIVCLDGNRPFGNGWLLPSGRLREPIRSLRRSDAIVIFDSVRIVDFVQKLPNGIPVFFATKKIVNIRDGMGETVNLAERKVFGFCGLGNPESFRKSLAESGGEIIGFRAFRDHNIYDSVDIRRIVDEAEKSSAEYIITTLKDFVKIGNIWRGSMPLYYLEIMIELDRERDFFELIG